MGRNKLSQRFWIRTKKNFLANPKAWYFCGNNSEFAKVFNNEEHCEEIKDLAKGFLLSANYNNVKIGNALLFVIATLSRSTVTHREVRIEFLNWVIKNHKQLNHETR